MKIMFIFECYFLNFLEMHLGHVISNSLGLWKASEWPGVKWTKD